MEKRIIVPEQRNYDQALAESLAIARQGLSTGDLADICRRSGAKFIDSDTVAIAYLGKEHRVTRPDAEVANAATDEKLPPRERLLALHYLLTAKGTPLAGRQITMKEVPDGLNYFPTFTKRALKPLIDTFGKEPGRLVEAGSKLGGRKTEYGDASVTINIFPRIPVTFVVWCGDDEFPAAASILFDASITDYLPVEDIIVASEITAWKLARLVK